MKPQSRIQDSSGAALIEVMISFLLGAVLMAALASFFAYQNHTMTSIRTRLGRDSVAALLVRNSANQSILALSAAYTGAGGWPGNNGNGDFRDCWLGGGTNTCAHGTERGLTLVDGTGTAILSGPGQNAGLRFDGATAVYSGDGKFCGGTADTPAVNPDAAKCPLVVYSTFTPMCENGACAAGIAARSFKIKHHIRQGNTANPVTLQGGGHLKDYVASVIVTKSSFARTFPITACPVGMVMAGTGRSVYCIESAARAAATWENASKICVGMGYSLCSYNQYAAPCISSAITHGASAEWGADVVGTAGRAGTLNVGGVCADNGDALVGAALQFRCCTQ